MAAGTGIIGNVDLGGWLEGLVGHPEETQINADAQVSIAEANANASSAVAASSIEMDKQHQETIVTVSLIFTGALITGLSLYALTKS